MPWKPRTWRFFISKPRQVTLMIFVSLAILSVNCMKTDQTSCVMDKILILQVFARCMKEALHSVEDHLCPTLCSNMWASIVTSLILHAYWHVSFSNVTSLDRAACCAARLLVACLTPRNWDQWCDDRQWVVLYISWRKNELNWQLIDVWLYIQATTHFDDCLHEVFFFVFISICCRIIFFLFLKAF